MSFAELAAVRLTWYDHDGMGDCRSARIRFAKVAPPTCMIFCHHGKL